MSAFTPPYPPFHTLAQMFTLLPPSLYGLTLTIPSPTLMRNRSFSHTHTHTRHHTLHIFTPTLTYTTPHKCSLSLALTPVVSHFTFSCLHSSTRPRAFTRIHIHCLQLTHTQYAPQHVHTNSHSLMVIHTFSLAHSQLRSLTCTHSL